MKFNQFLKECREKDIIKNLSIYLVSSWLLLQVVSVTWEPMGLPKSTLTYLLLFLLLGFPLYLYLLWKLRINKLRITPGEDPRVPVKGKVASTKRGVELNADGTPVPKETKYRRSFRQMYFSILLIIAALSVFSSTLIIKANFMNSQDTVITDIMAEESSDKIAVITFENNTTDPELDVVGKMAVDWIMHGITQNKLGQVISPKIVEDYTNVVKASLSDSKENKVLKEFLKPSRIITGNYFNREGQLLIQCSVLDQNMDKTLVSFEAVACDPDSPLDCIEALKQRILGYLATEKDNIADFEETPPNFEAYQYLLEANSQEDNTTDRYLELLNMAIDKDSTFFTPKVDRIQYYYNTDQFQAVDSLYAALSEEINLNKRQQNTLNLYQSLIQGDSRSAYRYFLTEYHITPFDLTFNSTALVLALQYVNRPQDMEMIYQAVSMKEMDLNKCLYCEFRTYTMALALIDMGRTPEALQILAPYEKLSDHALVKEAIIRSYAQQGDKPRVDQLVNDFMLSGDSTTYYKLSLFAAKEFMREGHPEMSKAYLEAVISELAPKYNELEDKNKSYLRQAYYFAEDYTEAHKLYSKQDMESLGVTELAYYAVCSNKLGDNIGESKAVTSLNALRGPYRYGDVDYALAQYYAATERPQEALESLLKAIAAGNRYTPAAYKYDLHFVELVDKPEFRNILEFWY